jgi:cation transport regulator ChaB
LIVPKPPTAACKNNIRNNAVRTQLPCFLSSIFYLLIRYAVASEKYRDDLRRRDETIRSLRENAALYEIETAKWQKEHDTYEERLAALQSELNLALQAHSQLDEQKQENLLLKETIDRMRYEMDEMRSATSSGLGVVGSGTSSAMNTLSKSLGAELMGKMKWGIEEEDEDTGRDDLASDTTTAVEIEEDENTECEDEEDVIQTIITKRTRVRAPPSTY